MAEILGHTNFDGEDWAIGDTLIFEDGTTATIRLEDNDEFHVWTDNVPLDLSDAINQIIEYRTTASEALSETDNWESLFEYFQEHPNSQPGDPGYKPHGCMNSIAFLAAAVLVFFYVWTP